MWFHLELKGHGRKAAHSGLAVAENPAGPYRFLRSLRPDAGTWPLNVTNEQREGLEEAQKLLGTAYHVFSSEENAALHVSQLAPDHLAHTGRWTRIFEYLWHEAPALCKHDGRYWMLSSHCTG